VHPSALLLRTRGRYRRRDPSASETPPVFNDLDFPPAHLPPAAEAMRQRIRAFIADERAKGGFVPRSDCWTVADTAFSRRLGAAGFIGMTWPKRYGGGEYSALERYVVVEELLAAGAPVGAHWIADRQSAPQLLRNGSEALKARIVPEIAAGRVFFAIGMSEPNVGSDLAAVSTRAEKVDGGWRITGRKVWTSFAHLAHYIIALVRTAPKSERRHEGLTQFVIDLEAPGVAVRPIENLSGRHDFNEVTFDGVFVADEAVVGGVGRGWEMVTAELAFERSGPERFMSTVPLLRKAAEALGPEAGERAEIEIGRAAAHLTALRAMSLSVASSLDRGAAPNTEASLVKDVGAVFEQTLPDHLRKVVPAEPSPEDIASYEGHLAHAVYHVPSFSLRGGTREILRGIIARGLGLR
jgi:alkylation response protein AidB-like acyl-CoA dehydrogenase